MATTITITSAVRNGDGTYTVTTSDGNGYEYGSLNDIHQEISDIDSDPRHCAAVALGYWLSREPAGDNVSMLNGKACTFDLKGQNAVWIR